MQGKSTRINRWLADAPPRIGVSACLLGRKVRFDGGHKEDPFITRTLGRYFEWVAICPEVEMGLGTPRKAMRLVQGAGGKHRLVVARNGQDLTPEMESFARARVEALAGEDLSGFVLKSKSPSCGLERVPLYSARARPVRSGQGLFAAALVSRFPRLPVEEEGRLCDPRIRENWIERVFAYRRLQLMWRSRWTVRDLIEFHTAHKLTLLAHVPRSYEDLGRLVAHVRKIPRARLQDDYEKEFMQALKVIATRGRHANVLRHMAGYLRKNLDDASRRELDVCIEDYRRELVPLIVPLTLLNHHVRALGISYLAGQAYLNPHPKELALRNHV